MRDIRDVLNPARLRQLWAPPEANRVQASTQEVGPLDILAQLRAAVHEDLGADAELVTPVLDLIQGLLSGAGPLALGAPLAPPAAQDEGDEGDEGDEDGDDEQVDREGDEAGRDEDEDEDDDEDEDEDEDEDDDSDEDDDLPLEADLMGLLDQLEELLEAVQIWKQRDLGGAP